MAMKLLGLFICWQVLAVVAGIVAYAGNVYVYEEHSARRAKLYLIAAELLSAGAIALIGLLVLGISLLKG